MAQVRRCAGTRVSRARILLRAGPMGKAQSEYSSSEHEGRNSESSLRSGDGGRRGGRGAGGFVKRAPAGCKWVAPGRRARAALPRPPRPISTTDPGVRPRSRTPEAFARAAVAGNYKARHAAPRAAQRSPPTLNTMISLSPWLVAPAAAAALVLAALGTGRLIRRAARAHFTIVADLPRLGAARPGPRLPRRAVICGGRCAPPAGLHRPRADARQHRRAARRARVRGPL
jgi:hypothetical protein